LLNCPLVNPLPDPKKLAEMVTNVTQTMLRIRFHPDPNGVTGISLRWRTAVLPVPGARPITVGLSSDQRGCVALSAAMFSCPNESVDGPMIDDSLRELVNMTAGLVKGSLQLDQALGLPQVLGESASPTGLGPPHAQDVVLKADGLGLYLWVCEGILPKS